MTRFINPVVEAYDDNGDPIDGAKMNFYEAGTSTRKDTYSDIALTTTNANPVVADSAGRFGHIFLNVSLGSYQAVLTDASDVTIWTRDNLRGIDVAAANLYSATSNKSTNFSVVAANDGVLFVVDTSGGNVVVTLPDIMTDVAEGFRIGFMKSSASNALTINRAGTDLINGATSYTISEDAEVVLFIATDSSPDNWIATIQSQTVAGTGLTKSGSTMSVKDSGVTNRELSEKAQGICHAMPNGALTATISGNALTVSIVANDTGTAPTATDPVDIILRSAVPGNGDYGRHRLTSATSLTIGSGSTLGVTNSTTFRIWVVAFNNGGTIEVGVINCLTIQPSIYPLGRSGLASTTAEGGSGGADNSHEFYTSTALTNRPFTVLGYVEWGNGLTTAGTWNAAATQVTLYDDTTALPGQRVQLSQFITAAVSTGTTPMNNDNSIPQSSEGVLFMTTAMTATSKANLARVNVLQNGSHSSATEIGVAVFRNNEADALFCAGNGAGALTLGQIYTSYDVAIVSLSPVTYKSRAGGMSSGTFTANGINGTGRFNGAWVSFLQVEEIMG